MKNLKVGDILEKSRETNSFRPIGSKIKILEIGESLYKIQYLVKTEGGLLGDETSYFGKDSLECNYRLPKNEKIYEIPGFDGTMEALEKLTIIKK